MTNIKSYKLFIDGKWINAQSGETFDIINPANEQCVAKAANGDERDTLKAIDASWNAFKSWSSLPVSDRADIMMKIYNLMLANKEELAQTISLEMGKPIVQARNEVQNAASYVQWNAEEAKRVYGNTIPAWVPNKRLKTILQPIGPVAAITPWNFPLSMVTRKISPALAAGCTVVFKPAEQTPGSAVQFFEIAEQAGMPKGVINLITGNPSKIGNTLLSDKRIRKVTFTGSTKVGKLLLRQAADHVKKVSMELGGHAPFIVFDDADLEKAASSVVANKFFNAGQVCVCANRIYVQKSIQDELVMIVKQKTEALKIGNGLQEEVQLGPLVSSEALAKVKRQVDDSLSRGANLITGGSEYETIGKEKGYFYLPTILTEVNERMTIAQEETFGPVMPIFTFETEEEVIEKANNTDYGLAAYLFTENLSRSIRVSEALEYGMVGINDAAIAAVQAPFGGVKESGMGREGGPESLIDFLETKFISTVI